MPITMGWLPRFATVLVYVLFPLIFSVIGSLFFFLGGRVGVEDIPALLVWTLFYPYLFGGAPALLTGVTMSLVDVASRGTRIWRSGFVGAVYSFLWIVLAPLFMGVGVLKTFGVALVIGFVGWIAGLICGAITNRWMMPPSVSEAKV